MIYLFLILATGYLLGQIKFKGVSLGTTGILFVAIIFGYFKIKIPSEIMDLGLILFVYAVGLSVGRRFFRMFKKNGINFITISLITTGFGAIIAYFIAHFLRFPFDLTAGLYTGALTNTPALAAAMELAERFSKGSIENITAGYGIAYPFSMIGTVLFVQFLPKILKKDIYEEELKWLEKEQEESPKLLVKHFLVDNPNFFDKEIREINPNRKINITISRVKRNDEIFVATSNFRLKKGDIVRAVGDCEELKKLEFILGKEVEAQMDIGTDIVSLEIEVREKECIGKKLKDLQLFENYNIVATRLRRDDIEMAPKGNVALEIGDIIKVVGKEADVKNLMNLFQGTSKSIEETNMLPFLIGLFLGVAIGYVPVKFPNGVQIKLGAAGGVFLISLLIAHFGRIGKLYIYVPRAAINFSREIGLMLFLAGVGTTAGSSILKILQKQGLILFFNGALITVITILISLLLMIFIFKMNLPSIMGAISAIMTNPPALNAANMKSKTDLVNLSYASIYPLALIFKIIIAQIILML
jgi:putative transport protein